MNETMINFYGYKNLLHQGGTSFCSHDGHYAINIKTNVYSLYMDGSWAELAFDHCERTFFEMVDMITDIFGYKGYSVTGRSGGYVEPLIEGYSRFKAIDAIHSEYIGFDDFIIQQKVDSYAQAIIGAKRNMESIYKHSKNLSEVVDLVGKVYNGIIYV